MQFLLLILFEVPVEAQLRLHEEVPQRAVLSIPRSTLLDYDDRFACPAEFEERALDLVNRIRANYEKPALIEHIQLAWAAREHSVVMASRHQLSHSGWRQILDSSGYSATRASQNVAWNQSSPVQVVQAWFNSSGHRKNMLNAAYLYSAVGCVRTSDGGWWWTQYFAR